MEVKLEAVDVPLLRVFRSHGVTIGVRSNDDALLARVPEALPPDAELVATTDAQVWFSLVRASRGSARGSFLRLYAGTQLTAEGFRLSRLLHTLDVAIRAQIGLLTPDRVFVHAGVVVWQGRAIVIPGASGTGKTTLVAALVRAGATYYSDEYAVLDAAGKVHPYARPLSIRQGEHRRVRTSVASAESLGPATVGIVVSCGYQRDASWHVRELSQGAGVQLLFANSLAARHRPDFVLSVLATVARTATVLGGSRGDADDATIALLSSARILSENPSNGTYS